MLTIDQKNRFSAYKAEAKRIQELGRQMAAVNLKAEKGPTSDPVAGHIYVGNMSEPLRRLWVLWNTTAKELGDAEQDLHYGNVVSPHERQQKMQTVRGLLEKYHVLLAELQSSLIVEFPYLPKSGIPGAGIVFHKGWHVYLVQLGLRPTNDPFNSHMPPFHEVFGDADDIMRMMMEMAAQAHPIQRRHQDRGQQAIQALVVSLGAGDGMNHNHRPTHAAIGQARNGHR